MAQSADGAQGQENSLSFLAGWWRIRHKFVERQDDRTSDRVHTCQSCSSWIGDGSDGLDMVKCPILGRRTGCTTQDGSARTDVINFVCHGRLGRVHPDRWRTRPRRPWHTKSTRKVPANTAQKAAAHEI